jgi:hypothetical protein
MPGSETVIHFSTDQEQSGHILLGQTDGQAVQVTLLYPAEMADAYWPAAAPLVAENALQLQDGEYAQVQCLSDHAGLDPAADSDSDGCMTLNCL